MPRNPISYYFSHQDAASLSHSCLKSPRELLDGIIFGSCLVKLQKRNGEKRPVSIQAEMWADAMKFPQGLALNIVVWV